MRLARIGTDQSDSGQFAMRLSFFIGVDRRRSVGKFSWKFGAGHFK